MTIRDIFDSMDYGPAPESNAEALAWIAGHKATFGHWIDGEFTKPGQAFVTRNPANAKELATVTQGGAEDLDKAVAAARQAQPAWAKLPAHRFVARLRIHQQERQLSLLLAHLQELGNTAPHFLPFRVRLIQIQQGLVRPDEQIRCHHGRNGHLRRPLHCSAPK